MKKFITGVFILSLLLTPMASAFEYEAPLVDQIETYENTLLNGDGSLILGSQPFSAQNIYVAHNYSVGSDKDMYLATDQGLYITHSYDGPFSQHISWPDTLKNEKVTIVFEGNYHFSQNVMAYTNDEVYVSRNAGDDWSLLDLEPDGDYLKVDYSPNFDENEQYYYITETGLYRNDRRDGKTYHVLESTETEPIMDFQYYRTQPMDDRYTVQKGASTIMLTDDFGDTWSEYTFDSPIMGSAVFPDASAKGDILVGTIDTRLFIAETGLEFGEVQLPSEISQAYGLRYVPDWNTDTFLVFTDLGFYISYNQGDEWSRIAYQFDFISNPLKDFYITKHNSDIVIYMLLGNTLYRDNDISRELNEFMDGVDAEGEGYVPEGSAVSFQVIEQGEEEFAPEYIVDYAMLVIEEELNGQEIEYYMTADGETWEAVTPGEPHTFVNQGNTLKWKAVLTTGDAEETPMLVGAYVDYGLVEADNCAGFPDIKVTDPYCDAIVYVKDQGIFEGYPDGTFGADLEITRAETVKVITEGFDMTILEDDMTDLGFSDVEVGSWYMAYLKTAFEALIVEGYPDGTFGPRNTVNYVEMLKIFLETAEVELEEVVAEEGLWYDPYVAYAMDNGLLVYDELDAGMKRGDVAQLFYQWSLL